MPQPRKDQKKIAQQYAANPRYFNRFHVLRGTRFYLLLACTVAGLVAGGFYLAHWWKTPATAPTASTQPIGQSPLRKGEWFNSAGPISQAHAAFGQKCEECHNPAARADVTHPELVKNSLDESCMGCHKSPSYTFHQVNAINPPGEEKGPACIDCHLEHLGPGPMPPVADSNCVGCHGNKDVMAKASQLGQGMHSTMAPFRSDPHLTLFRPATETPDHKVSFVPLRPADGYTQVIHSFATDHPEFQIQRENLRDPDTLKFNHQFHFGPKVRKADGSPLACEDCHRPDSTGAYMQPVNYNTDCQSCHYLQMDMSEPKFLIPHPGANDLDSNSVRNFIKDLAPQYRNFAIQEKHLTSKAGIDKFVSDAMKRVQTRIRNGEDLEQEVFGSGIDTIYYGGASPAPSPSRSLFQGCAVCHQVTIGASGQREVTPPVIPDRWYVHAKFNHAAHASVLKCEDCHNMARESSDTADILLPGRGTLPPNPTPADFAALDKGSCVKCHSPAGGVASTCSTCHDYHNASPEAGKAVTLTPLRRMILGRPLTAAESLTLP